MSFKITFIPQFNNCIDFNALQLKTYFLLLLLVLLSTDRGLYQRQVLSFCEAPFMKLMVWRLLHIAVIMQLRLLQSCEINLSYYLKQMFFQINNIAYQVIIIQSRSREKFAGFNPHEEKLSYHYRPPMKLQNPMNLGS